MRVRLNTGSVPRLAPALKDRQPVRKVPSCVRSGLSRKLGWECSPIASSGGGIRFFASSVNLIRRMTKVDLKSRPKSTFAPAPTPAEPPKPSIGKLVLPGVLLTIFCLVPFLNKAFTIDDPNFLLSARQILQHPFRPMTAMSHSAVFPGAH